jgi:hypothetical protein
LASADLGFSAATRLPSLKLTVAGIRTFVAAFRSWNVVSDTPVTPSANVTDRLFATGTVLAPAAGTCAATAGATRSGATGVTTFERAE